MSLMKKYICLPIFFSLPLHASFVEIKEAIAEKQKTLLEVQSNEERSRLYFDLSLAYYSDQETDKAFENFLEALKLAPSKTLLDTDEKEAELYQRALNDYLSQAGSDPIRVAKELLDDYGEIATQNTSYISLNFLIATAYANLGKYEDFFERFYRGFPYLKETFLAYKIQGILYLRLSQHGKSAEERYAFQKEAFQYLTHALDRNPKDPSLYKVLIFLAKDEKKDGLILTYLRKMVEYQTHIPRSDIYLYVREAVAMGEIELGQKIVDQARALYDYSRSISAAQEYLNQHRG